MGDRAPLLRAMPRALSIAALLCFFQAGASRAAPLDLGPFPARLVLYGVASDVSIEPSADVSTTAAGAHLALDARASASASQLAANIEAIAKARLPIKVAAGPCEFSIQSLTATQISVSGNTGTFATTVAIAPSGCPLSAGSVTLSVRFVPQTTPAQLGVKITDVAVQTPFQWRFLGLLAGKSPEQQIAAAIRAQAAALSLPMPAINHARAAFQGASLDAKGDTLIFRVLADLQADRQAIVDELMSLEAVKNLEVRYP